MKSADIAKSEFYEGAGTDTPTRDEQLGPKRHPLKKGKSDSALDRRRESKKKGTRKSDIRSNVYF